MNPLPTWLRSSVDSNQPSLTLESLGKLIIGLVGMYAAMRGLDVGVATSQAELFVEQGITIGVSAFTMYHALMTVYGLARKLFMRTVVPATTMGVPEGVFAEATPTAKEAATTPQDWQDQSVG